jgi:signal transduction histidine kinase
VQVHGHELVSSLPARQAKNRAQLTEAIAVADETMEQIRLLAHNLRPPADEIWVTLQHTMHTVCLLVKDCGTYSGTGLAH